MSNTLPINSNLTQREIDMDVTYSLYGAGMETINYIIRDCP